jgi:FAD binding domain/Berberine and berberine like
VGPGVRLGDLYAGLAEHERTLPAGCGATVGIGGQALGGGLGLLGRSQGLTSDQVVAAQVVLADGQVVECDEQRHDDLFWALRGAGALGLGVVTRLTFRTVPEPAATSFHLEWPYERASALIAAWQEWSPTGPDRLAASMLLTVGGDADADPVVHLFGSMIGSETDTAALLEEFASLAGADPASSDRAHMRYGFLKNHLAESGPGDQEDEDGAPYMKSEFFGEPLPSDAVEALVEQFVRERRPGEERKLDFMPWGGAYNRVPADATAFPHREELFLLEHSVVLPAGSDAPATKAARAWLSDSWDLVHPSGSGGVYANFPDEDLPDEHRAYWRGNLERVRRVKERYDPEGVFG